MKLSTWITNNGGTTATGKILGVSASRVHAWVTGVALPQAMLMMEIVTLTKGKVSLHEMVTEYLDKRYTVLSKKKKKKPNAHNLALKALSAGKLPPRVRAKKKKINPLGF